MKSLHTVLPFNHFKPSKKVLKVIQWAQNCPHNKLGKIIALIIRKYVKSQSVEVIDVEVNGLKFRTNLHDNVCERKYIFMPWLYDQIEHQFMLDNLANDGVFIDVGANIGIYSLWATQILGEKGTIISFEPNPNMFERLQNNLSFNKTSATVYLYNQGVADNAGTMNLYLDPKNFGGSSLLRKESGSSKITVSVITLLEKVKDLNLKRIDLLKIDIEGAEEQALLPYFQQVPKQLLPKAIIIENSDDLWKTDLRKTFLKLGYQLINKTKMNSIYQLMY